MAASVVAAKNIRHLTDTEQKVGMARSSSLYFATRQVRSHGDAACAFVTAPLNRSETKQPNNQKTL
jgi:hypothetical protein